MNGVKPMTTKQRDLRRYFFRSLVADADTKSPGLFILTSARGAPDVEKGAMVAAIMRTDASVRGFNERPLAHRQSPWRKPGADRN